MKKTLAVLIIIFLIMIFSAYVLIKNIQDTNLKLVKENKKYEDYLNKTIYGTELVTLINIIIDKNEKNNVEKDEKGYYIENEINSIKLEIKILQTNLTYPMEEFYNNDMREFVKYYNLEEFKCTKIEYHQKSNKVKKMYFEQVEK